MPVPISADEVFEMACQIERNGIAFYRRAAENAQDGWAREMLTALADMEVEHEQTFSQMRAEFASRGGGLVQDDPEAAKYLRALVKGRVFSGAEAATEKLSAGLPLAEVIRAAIALEKDSIVFYAGIRESVPGRDGKTRIDAIIREELSHIATLNAALDEL